MNRSVLRGLDGAWRRTAVSVAVAAAAALAANVAFWAHISANPVNTGIGRVWQKWRMLERMQTPVDWVIIGDSTCGQSVRPDVIERETGNSAVNLCTVGNALAVNAAWQARRYIERFGPPRRIVAVFSFETFERDTTDLKSLLDQIPLPYGFWRRMPPHLDLTLQDEAGRLFRPFYSLYAYNLSAKALLRNFLSGAGGGTAWSDLEGIERQKGFVMEIRGDPDRVARESEAAAARALERDFRMTAENEAALKDLVALSDQHGFDLYIANAPISARLYEDGRFKRYYSQVNAALKSIVASGRNAHLALEEPAQYPDHQLSDFEHLIGEEATADLTHRLVADVTLSKSGAAGEHRR